MSVDPTKRTYGPPGGSGFQELGAAVGEIFQNLLAGVGNILGGAIEAGVGVLSAVADGVISFIDGVARAIGSIFGFGSDDPEPEPLPEVFSPIKANLEAALKPHFDDIDKALEQSKILSEDLEKLNTDLDEKIGEQGTLTQSISDLSGELGKKVNEGDFSAYRQTMESLVGEQGTLTQSISDLSGELGKKVNEGDFSTYKQTMESLVGEQGTLTQSISDLSGELDKKVTISTFTQYEEGMEEQLWGENGELWRINSTLWDEQEGWNATQQKINNTNEQLWGDQGELNRINSTLWDEQEGWNATQQTINDQQEDINALLIDQGNLHSQMMSTMMEAQKAQQQYISRSMPMFPNTNTSNDHWRAEDTGTRWSLTARDDVEGTWVGQAMFQGAYSTGRGWEPVIEHFSIPTSEGDRDVTFAGSDYMGILTYWVEPGEQQVHSVELGSFVPGRDVWWVHPDLTFTAPDTGGYIMDFRVGWDATTYQDTYGICAFVNGTWRTRIEPRVGLGPRTPFENGYRNQRFTRDGWHLNEGDEVKFAVWAGAPGADQRRVRNLELTLAWVRPPSEGKIWQMQTTGDGGFLQKEGMEDAAEWNWQNSIRFLNAAVIPSRAVAVHSYDTGQYVPIAAGTTIPRATWIRTVEPHPATVTFTEVT